ncbi:hypothetical protein TNCV_4235861 [Trichonephila clavipes]|nr:hypothetical protein TNCV_4235861 [Trichonephila clavipes]
MNVEYSPLFSIPICIRESNSTRPFLSVKVYFKYLLHNDVDATDLDVKLHKSDLLCNSTQRNPLEEGLVTKEAIPDNLLSKTIFKKALRSKNLVWRG